MTTTGYLSNDLNILKREALSNLDIDTLKAIKDYEKFCKSQVFYFARLGENFIRDAQGNIIDQTILPFPKNQTFQNYGSMIVGVLIPDVEHQPGDLYKSICKNADDRDRLRVLIFELPETVVFPLPDGFGWAEWGNVCKDYIVSTGYVPDYSLRYRFN